MDIDFESLFGIVFTPQNVPDQPDIDPGSLAILKKKTILTDELIKKYNEILSENDRLYKENAKHLEELHNCRQKLLTNWNNSDMWEKRYHEVQLKYTETNQELKFNINLVEARDSVLRQYVDLVKEKQDEISQLKVEIELLKANKKASKSEDTQWRKKYFNILKRSKKLSESLNNSQNCASCKKLEKESKNKGTEDNYSPDLEFAPGSIIPCSVSSVDTGFESPQSLSDCDSDIELSSVQRKLKKRSSLVNDVSCLAKPLENEFLTGKFTSEKCGIPSEICFSTDGIEVQVVVCADSEVNGCTVNPFVTGSGEIPVPNSNKKVDKFVQTFRKTFVDAFVDVRTKVFTKSAQTDVSSFGNKLETFHSVSVGTDPIEELREENICRVENKIVQVNNSCQTDAGNSDLRIDSELSSFSLTVPDVNIKFSSVSGDVSQQDNSENFVDEKCSSDNFEVPGVVGSWCPLPSLLSPLPPSPRVSDAVIMSNTEEQIEEVSDVPMDDLFNVNDMSDNEDNCSFKNQCVDAIVQTDDFLCSCQQQKSCLVDVAVQVILPEEKEDEKKFGTTTHNPVVNKYARKHCAKNICCQEKIPREVDNETFWKQLVLMMITKNTDGNFCNSLLQMLTDEKPYLRSFDRKSYVPVHSANFPVSTMCKEGSLGNFTVVEDSSLAPITVEMEKMDYQTLHNSMFRFCQTVSKAKNVSKEEGNRVPKELPNSEKREPKSMPIKSNSFLKNRGSKRTRKFRHIVSKKTKLQSSTDKYLTHSQSGAFIVSSILNDSCEKGNLKPEEVQSEETELTEESVLISDKKCMFQGDKCDCSLINQCSSVTSIREVLTSNLERPDNGYDQAHTHKLTIMESNNECNGRMISDKNLNTGTSSSFGDTNASTEVSAVETVVLQGCSSSIASKENKTVSNTILQDKSQVQNFRMSHLSSNSSSDELDSLSKKPTVYHSPANRTSNVLDVSQNNHPKNRILSSHIHITNTSTNGTSLKTQETVNVNDRAIEEIYHIGRDLQCDEVSDDSGPEECSSKCPTAGIYKSEDMEKELSSPCSIYSEDTVDINESLIQSFSSKCSSPLVSSKSQSDFTESPSSDKSFNLMNITDNKSCHNKQKCRNKPPYELFLKQDSVKALDSEVIQTFHSAPGSDMPQNSNFDADNIRYEWPSPSSLKNKESSGRFVPKGLSKVAATNNSKHNSHLYGGKVDNFLKTNIFVEDSVHISSGECHKTDIAQEVVAIKSTSKRPGDKINEVLNNNDEKDSFGNELVGFCKNNRKVSCDVAKSSLSMIQASQDLYSTQNELISHNAFDSDSDEASTINSVAESIVTCDVPDQEFSPEISCTNSTLFSSETLLAQNDLSLKCHAISKNNDVKQSLTTEPAKSCEFLSVNDAMKTSELIELSSNSSFGNSELEEVVIESCVIPRKVHSDNKSSYSRSEDQFQKTLHKSQKTSSKSPMQLDSLQNSTARKQNEFCVLDVDRIVNEMEGKHFSVKDTREHNKRNAQEEASPENHVETMTSKQLNENKVLLKKEGNNEKRVSFRRQSNLAINEIVAVKPPSQSSEIALKRKILDKAHMLSMTPQKKLKSNNNNSKMSKVVENCNVIDNPFNRHGLKGRRKIVSSTLNPKQLDSEFDEVLECNDQHYSDATRRPLRVAHAPKLPLKPGVNLVSDKLPSESPYSSPNDVPSSCQFRSSLSESMKIGISCEVNILNKQCSELPCNIPCSKPVMYSQLDSSVVASSNTKLENNTKLTKRTVKSSSSENKSSVEVQPIVCKKPLIPLRIHGSGIGRKLSLKPQMRKSAIQKLKEKCVKLRKISQAQPEEIVLLQQKHKKSSAAQAKDNVSSMKSSDLIVEESALSESDECTNKNDESSNSSAIKTFNSDPKFHSTNDTNLQNLSVSIDNQTVNNLENDLTLSDSDESSSGYVDAGSGIIKEEKHNLPTFHSEVGVVPSKLRDTSIVESDISCSSSRTIGKFTVPSSSVLVKSVNTDNSESFITAEALKDGKHRKRVEIDDVLETTSASFTNLDINKSDSSSESKINSPKSKVIHQFQHFTDKSASSKILNNEMELNIDDFSIKSPDAFSDNLHCELSSELTTSPNNGNEILGDMMGEENETVVLDSPLSPPDKHMYAPKEFPCVNIPTSPVHRHIIDYSSQDIFESVNNCENYSVNTEQIVDFSDTENKSIDECDDNDDNSDDDDDDDDHDNSEIHRTSTTYFTRSKIHSLNINKSNSASFSSEKHSVLFKYFTQYCPGDKEKKKSKQLIMRKVKCEERIQSILDGYVEGEFTDIALTNTVNECKKISKDDIGILAKCVVRCVKYTPRDAYDYSNPNAAPLTTVQKYLLILVIKLQEFHATIVDDILERIHFVVCDFKHHHYDATLFGLARFFLAFCKLRNDKHRLQMFCYDALYFLKLRGYTIINAIVTGFADFFPKSGCNPKDSLIAKTIAFVIFTYGKAAYLNTSSIRNFFGHVYEYKRDDMPSLENLLKTFVEEIKRGETPEVEQALLLVSKFQNDWNWTYTKVIKGCLLPIIVSWKLGNASEKAAILSINLAGYLARTPPYQKEDALSLMLEVGKLLSSHTCPSSIKEACIHCMASLVMVNENIVFNFLKKCENDAYLENSEVVKNALKIVCQRRTNKWFKRFLNVENEQRKTSGRIQKKGSKNLKGKKK